MNLLLSRFEGFVSEIIIQDINLIYTIVILSALIVRALIVRLLFDESKRLYELTTLFRFALINALAELLT